MGTFRAAIFALAVISVAQAQAPDLDWKGKTYSVGESRVVADRVGQVSWSRDGLDLAYTRVVDGGQELGLYNLAQSKGAAVAMLAKGETIIQLEWLSTEHKLLFITQRLLENRPVPTDAFALKVADARELKCRELWSGESPVSDGTNFDVEVSPTLAHAIVVLHSAKATRYLVLTLGGDAVVESSDVEEAHKQGQELAGWSINGTAIFAPQTDETSKPFRLTASNGVIRTSGNATIELKVSTAASAAPQNFILSFDYRSQPDIELGASTFECVPGNGVLRQIRFPGYYAQPEQSEIALAPDFRQSDLNHDGTTAKVKSLWLVPNVPDVDAKRPPLPGLLVSADADEAWQAPSGRAIAFTCHHALFVRDIASKR